jgi:hypothetical protein
MLGTHASRIEIRRLGISTVLSSEKTKGKEALAKGWTGRLFIYWEG